MSQYSGSVPDTPRKPDWRLNAACREAPVPDLFFETGSEETAKAYCRSCPSINACLKHAFDVGENYGVFGGLTQRERAAIRRGIARNQLTSQQIAARVQRARTPHHEQTLRGAVTHQTTPLPGRHLGWTGSQKIHHQGRVYTPKQAVFVVDRGHEPDGRVQTTCDVAGCVLPRHLADQGELARWRAATRQRAA